MQKCLFIIISVLILYLPQQGCVEESNTASVKISNISISAVYVTFYASYAGAVGHNYEVTVDPSSEKTIKVAPDQYDWTVRETSGNEVVGSGTIYISYNMWLEVEFENGVWSCTWHG